MNYEESLEYLSSLLRFGIKFGLDRFTELCNRMGNPQDKLKAIHVGGTNGKGSTCTFITSILRAAGYSVGTYLSPYVYDVRERIQLNGRMIPKDDFAALMTEMKPVMEEIGCTEFGQVTEFEAKTLMAFLYFARRNVEFAVIEVGMGGRYDATNLVHPLVSVITNVSLDHVERLGETVEQIAWDKTGIAKPGAPLVTAADCGIRTADCGIFGEHAWRRIYTTARKQDVEEIWRVRCKECVPAFDAPAPDEMVIFDGDYGSVTISMPDMYLGPLTLQLVGDFQLANAATAAAAVFALMRRHPAFRIPQSAFEEGLTKAYLPGRLEVLRYNPTVVIDAAHNPDGAQRLVESVQNTFKYRKLILVIGMLSTHSAEDVLNYLAPRADEVIATKSQWDKARPAEDIADAACQLNPNVRIVEPVPAAVQAALESATADDLILVTGSFYTIGEVDRDFVADWVVE